MATRAFDFCFTISIGIMAMALNLEYCDHTGYMVVDIITGPPI